MKETKAYSTEATLLAERERRLECEVNLANPNYPANLTFAEREMKNHKMNATTYLESKQHLFQLFLEGNEKKHLFWIFMYFM